jgi:S-adenosylmethionine:tRNA ribosyltransferase-isomerase
MAASSDSHYDLDHYHYDLPGSLIAQEPLKERDGCRLLILRRTQGTIEHSHFSEITSLLHPGDVLVLNDTRVVPARLMGTKQTGGRIELLVLEPFELSGSNDDEGYSCLVKAAKPPKPQSIIDLKNGLQAKVLTLSGDGKARVCFLTSEPLPSLLQRAGEVPLPPYIRRNGSRLEFNDATYYQTVYAREPGSVAAPTAGLHFTAGLLQELERLGIEIINITLHVGYGTFAPVRVADIRQHSIHPEFAVISQESARRITAAKKQGRRIVAVGTTSVRLLEWLALKHEAPTGISGSGISGYCDLYIYPGFPFRMVDAVITNFHLPKTSLLLLVCAFAGRETMLNAYYEAIGENYRFYSYGDVMLIL